MRVDRQVFSVGTFEDNEEELKAFWKKQSYHDRLLAVEILRQQVHDYDPNTARLSRVLEVSERTWR